MKNKIQLIKRKQLKSHMVSDWFFILLQQFKSGNYVIVKYFTIFGDYVLIRISAVYSVIYHCIFNPSNEIDI